MLKYLLATSLLMSTAAHAQIPYIDSKEQITKGIELYDKGEYKNAIGQFQQMHECDTNYALARYEMALALLADTAYEQVKAVSKDGLKLHDGDTRGFMLTLAAAYDYLKQSDSALETYELLAKKYPNDHQPYYEAGIIYLRQKDYDKALSSFQRSLTINPNHFASHYMTGLSYALQGRLSESFIALESSLLMTDNEASAKKSIGLISDITSQTDEMVKLYREKKEQYSHPLFDEIDQIVNSKIALSTKYKLKVSIDDQIFRQSQVITEKLKYDPDDTNFVMQFYVPLLTQIFKDDMFEQFMLLKYSGYGFENVDNLAKKKSKEITEIKSVVFPYFTKVQETRELNYVKRQKTQGLYHYYPSDNLIIVGNLVKEGKDISLKGDAVLYRTNHSLHSKGRYDNTGMKDGWWNFYYATGELKSKEHFSHGQRTDSSFIYFENGNLKDITIRDKDGVAKEEYKYDRGGFLADKKKVLPNDIIEHWTYYSNGQLEFTEKYDSKKTIDGEYTVFYPSGHVKKKVSYLNGQTSGTTKVWFDNGKLSEECSYVNGKIDGTYTEYYENGKIKEKSQYRNGKQDGIDEKYDEKGRLTDKYVYNNGKMDELNKFTTGGVMFGKMKASKNIPYYVKYTSEDGKVLIEKEEKGGIKSYQHYYANGNMAADLKINDDGVRDGLNTFYHESGSKSEETNYKEGNAEGSSVLFYKCGKTKQEANYVNDQLDGYFKDYHANGNLKSEGWYKAGERQGPWKLYNINGTLEAEQYYLNGKLSGRVKEYNIAGKIVDKYYYEEGEIYKHVCYDTGGHVVDSIAINPASAICRTTYRAGGERVNDLDYGMKNGNLDGEYTRRYLTGTVAEKSAFKNGKHDGPCIEYYPDGKVRLKGDYKDGEKIGKWEYYNDAGLLMQEEEYRAEGLSDITKTYAAGELRRVSYDDSATVYYGDPGRAAFVFYYDKEGVTSYSYEGKDGKLIPPVKIKNGTAAITAYYSNGQKSAELQLEQHLFKGKMEVYYSNGKLSENIHYDNEFFAEGPRNRYNMDGKPQLETNYTDDEEMGTEKIYDKEGNLLASVGYYYGVRNGPTVITDPKTHTSSTYYYHFGRLISVSK